MADISVKTAKLKQLFRSTILCQFSVRKHCHMVSLLQCGNPVGNHYGCLALSGFHEVFKYLLLCIGIDSRKRIIQYEDCRIL